MGTITEQYSEKDKYALSGILIKINLNDDSIGLYQHVYQFSMVDQKKTVIAIRSRDKIYKPLKEDILRIDTRIDLMVINNSIITTKIDILQKYFKYDMQIRSAAESTVNMIKELDIVTDITILSGYRDDPKLTVAKKLMRARNSPVLKMDPSNLLERVKRHPRYKDKFSYDNGRINITTKKMAKEFIKLLNDDILRSEISDAEYDTSSKKALDPVVE